MTRRSVAGLFSFLVLVAAAAGCAPAPGVSGAPGTAAYVQHLAADQVDTWRGVHYDGLILDVRSTVEWEDDLNHLDNAVQAPVETLESRLHEFDRYRNGTVLVYDRMGGNSTRAAQILVTHEFKDVSVIDGGLKAYRDWQKAAHP
jgi:rhodanese-related sulfurtransferase